MARLDANHYDVVIVGARPAGASLAIHLARAGKTVAVVDKATFPSDTVSTHVVYPNTLKRLDELGALDRVMEKGPPPLYTAWYHEGRMFTAPHKAQDGRDWALCVTRYTLDKILVDRAREEGATVFEGFTVTSFAGAGDEESPLKGVIGTHDGETVALTAPVVIGADGANSTLARHVGAKKSKIMPTETMLYYAYWEDVPTRNTQDFFFECPWVCAHFPADSGKHVITMNGPVGLRREIKDMEAFYMEKVRSVPGLGERLKGAKKVSRVLGTPKLDGFYRTHTGPGWALVGDAAHFKHPASAQGICDALHASEALSDMLLAGAWREAYPAWREHESRELYAFCKHLREAPSDEAMRNVFDHAIRDPFIARELIDTWARNARPFEDVVPRVPGMENVVGASIDSVLAEFDDAQPLRATA